MKRCTVHVLQELSKLASSIGKSLAMCQACPAVVHSMAVHHDAVIASTELQRRQTLLKHKEHFLLSSYIIKCVLQNIKAAAWPA